MLVMSNLNYWVENLDELDLVVASIQKMATNHAGDCSYQGADPGGFEPDPTIEKQGLTVQRGEVIDSK